tara:strand:- start:679 stop:1053 length:375 start_codon:yes stop_codon:yes gene_type:complete
MNKIMITDFINNVAIFLLICGFMLFWYIDWYWVILFYNILFSYFAFITFIDYNENPRYRNKIPLFFYIMLPFVFNFIGFLISVVNGFEEISEDEIQSRKNIDKKELEEVFETKNMKTNSLKKFS